MIHYSVYMMQNPIHPEKGSLAYATPQVREKLSTSKFISHVASHNTVFSKGTIKGVLADIASCLREQLLNGNKVQLEGLGTFGITLNSQGAESLKAFTADNIKNINIVFTPDAELENLIDDAAFDLVASRAAQAATLKAEKAGEGTVDLDAAKKKVTQSTDNPQV